MSDDIRPRIRLPRSARAGESIVVKTLVNHEMETGQRRDASGAVIPRQILNRFTCAFNGRMVVDFTLEPAVSANPYLEFEAVVDQSGEFVFTWYDDNGIVHEHRQEMTVS
jgi:sulfur-oxidizing protein SoxZ